MSVATIPEIPPNGVCIWKPNPGEQTEFLASVEREILFGGRAGCGKTDALVMSAARYYKNSAHRAIMFKKIFKEMQEIMERCEMIYPWLGGHYIAGRKQWKFPGGATIEFGYLDKKKDIQKYKRAWNWIGFDDLTHWPPDGQDRDGNPVNENYLQLINSRLRSVESSGLPLEVRSTTNPDQIGREWVKKRFNIPDAGGHSEYFDRTTNAWRLFIPGKFCPQLSGTSYERDLEGLPEHLKKMLKDGRWDVIMGAMFKEFDFRIHTCDPITLPEGCRIWRSADDGYNAPACILWFAEIDKRVYVFDELYRSGMVAELMAEEVKKRDLEICFRDGSGSLIQNHSIIDGIIDSSAFNESGMTSSGTGRGQRMNQLGCKWKPAQKGPGSRIAGWNIIHSMLKNILPDGMPQLVISKKCKNLIRTITAIAIDESNPDDCETDGDDHPPDALRYGLQWRPKTLVVGKVSGV